MKKLFLFSFLLVAVSQASAQTCTVWDTVFTADGLTPAGKGIEIVLHRAEKAGVLIIASPIRYFTNRNGIFSFKVVQGANAWIQAPIAGFRTAGGVTVAIPASDSVRLSTLQSLGLIKTAGLLVRDDGVDVDLVDSLDFLSDFSATAIGTQRAKIKLKINLNADDFSTIYAAFDQAETDTAMLIVNSRQTITQNDTLKLPAAIYVTPKGKLRIASGDTLWIFGDFIAGKNTAFEGSGEVVFKNNSIEYAYPEWWGAVGDSVADDSAAIQATYDAIKLSGGGTIVLTGKYKTTGTLQNVPNLAETNDNVGFVMTPAAWIDNNFWPANTDNGASQTALRKIIPLRYRRINTKSNAERSNVLTIGSIEVLGYGRNLFKGDLRIEPNDSLLSQRLSDPTTDITLSSPTSAQRVQMQYRRAGDTAELQFAFDKTAQFAGISWRRRWDYLDNSLRGNGWPVASGTPTWTFGVGNTSDNGSPGTDDLAIMLGWHPASFAKVRFVAPVNAWGTDTLGINTANIAAHPDNYQAIFRGPVIFEGGVWDPDSFATFFDLHFEGEHVGATQADIDSIYLFRMRDDMEDKFSVTVGGDVFAKNLTANSISFSTKNGNVSIDSINGQNDALLFFDDTSRAYILLPESRIELLQNGDMEATTNWVSTGSATTNRSSTQARTGTYSWKIVTSASPAGDEGITNSTSFGPTVTGDVIRVSFWLYVIDAAKTEIKLYISKGDGTLWQVNQLGIIGTLNTWTHHHLVFIETAGGSSGRIDFSSSVSSQTFYIDDVNVQNVGRNNASVRMPIMQMVNNTSAPNLSRTKNSSFFFAMDINSGSEMFAMDEAQNSTILTENGTNSFSGSATEDTLLLSGVTTGSIFFLNIQDATPVANDMLSWTVNTDTLFVHRVAGTTASLKYSWMRVK